jgi:predicted nucleic acid-binding protein
VVIDTGVLSKMFNPRNSDYGKYDPFRKWIKGAKGCIVYGGTKYLEELAKLITIMRLITELGRAGKAKCLPRPKVDTEQKRIEGLCNKNRFNDAHILAIAIVGKCKCICSEDLSAHPFFKNRDLLYLDAGLPRFSVVHCDTTDLNLTLLYA